MTRCFTFGFLAFATLLVLGCSQDEGGDDAPSVDGSKYVLKTEPAGAQAVEAVRKDAKDGDEVVVVGRIGGKPDPWGKGYATFTIVDESLKPCNERDDDTCPTPWDYCCDLSDLTDKSAFVEFVDESGKVVKADAKKLLAVKELQTVVVHGKAVRDETGNFTLQADGIFVRK